MVILSVFVFVLALPRRRVDLNVYKVWDKVTREEPTYDDMTMDYSFCPCGNLEINLRFVQVLLDFHLLPNLKCINMPCSN
jgi:hypothetical protein